MRDTSVEVDDLRLTLVRGLDPRARLRQALEGSLLARRLALTRLRQAHPGLTQRELVALWLHENFPTLMLPGSAR
jgi:hypothetical protein